MMPSKQHRIILNKPEHTGPSFYPLSNMIQYPHYEESIPPQT